MIAQHTGRTGGLGGYASWGEVLSTDIYTMGFQAREWVGWARMGSRRKKG